MERAVQKKEVAEGVEEGERATRFRPRNQAQAPPVKLQRSSQEARKAPFSALRQIWCRV